MKPRLKRLHQTVDKIIENIANEHRTIKVKAAKSVAVGEEEDLVDALLNIQDKGDLEFPLTTENIKAVILGIFIGGSDTSSTPVEWAMSEMLRNPRVMIKARRVPRECRESCIINGYHIPEKPKVIVNEWAIGRDPNYWSEAERFYPERFLDNSIDYKGTNFEFIPFGAGRRMCPGILFGMANVELPLAQFLYHFDWELPCGLKPENLDMTEALNITMRRRNPLYAIPIPYLPPPVK
ncbi:hypothetical protein GH714_011569 [Hevea brasiliensis]|uniref:Cytochrome P450 n=1 Tax=Hevea brasiliensis TaxID=3981 RepID=A0A6A6MJV5_HEVBR|nr:hypothetical protein GH714_011569 [Hevea brasiliensis]